MSSPRAASTTRREGFVSSSMKILSRTYTCLSRIPTRYSGAGLFVVNEPFEEAAHNLLSVSKRRLFPSKLRSASHADFLSNNIGVISKESTKIKRRSGVIAGDITSVLYVNGRKQVWIF